MRYAMMYWMGERPSGPPYLLYIQEGGVIARSYDKSRDNAPLHLQPMLVCKKGGRICESDNTVIKKSLKLSYKLLISIQSQQTSRLNKTTLLGACFFKVHQLNIIINDKIGSK